MQSCACTDVLVLQHVLGLPPVLIYLGLSTYTAGRNVAGRSIFDTGAGSPHAFRVPRANSLVPLPSCQCKGMQLACRSGS
eukprot:1147653-Pelagomonas_calceolata.AAC.2